MTFVIQYADLEDMILELDTTEKVRLTKIKSYEGQNAQGLVSEVIGIHVRQIRGDKVFAWMYPVARYRTNRGQPLEPQDEETMIAGWERAEEVSKLIVTRLLNEDTFKIRPGIIDLGQAMPLAGYWSLLDDEEEEEDQPE